MLLLEELLPLLSWRCAGGGRACRQGIELLAPAVRLLAAQKHAAALGEGDLGVGCEVVEAAGGDDGVESHERGAVAVVARTVPV